MRLPRSTIAAVALALACALLPAFAVPAAAGPERRDLAGEALWIMSMTYPEFAAFTAAGTEGYPFDFTSDGCVGTAEGLRIVFDGPCRLHDFGYANFGNGRRLGRTEDTRRWIDDRFLEEMYRACSDRLVGDAQQYNLGICREEADAVAAEARRSGAAGYFGPDSSG